MKKRALLSIGILIINIAAIWLAVIVLRNDIGHIASPGKAWVETLVPVDVTIMSLVSIVAIFNILVVGLMPWLKNYQHLKLVGIATSGVLVLSAVELIILGAKIGKLI